MDLDVTLVERKEKLGSIKTTSRLNVEKESDKSQESDTPVKENEEAMLPEDGFLLRYILKADRRERDVESVHLENKVECGDAAVATAGTHDKDFCYTEENSLMYSR